MPYTAYAGALGVYLDAGLLPPHTPVPLWEDTVMGEPRWHVRTRCALLATAAQLAPRPLADVVARLRADDSDVSLCSDCSDTDDALILVPGYHNGDSPLVRTLVRCQARLEFDNPQWPLANAREGLTELACTGAVHHPDLAAYATVTAERLRGREHDLRTGPDSAARRTRAVHTIAGRVAAVRLAPAAAAFAALPAQFVAHAADYLTSVPTTAAERDAASRQAAAVTRTMVNPPVAMVLDKILSLPCLDAVAARLTPGLAGHTSWVRVEHGHAESVPTYLYELADVFDPLNPQLLRVPTAAAAVAALFGDGLNQRPGRFGAPTTVTFLAPGRYTAQTVAAAWELADSDPAKMPDLLDAVTTALR